MEKDGRQQASKIRCRIEGLTFSHLVVVSPSALDLAEYAQVQKMLGNGRVECACFDGEKRIAHIRGKMRKKVRLWICCDYPLSKWKLILEMPVFRFRSFRSGSTRVTLS